jgi:hypothetical protein
VSGLKVKLYQQQQTHEARIEGVETRLDGVNQRIDTITTRRSLGQSNTLIAGSEGLVKAGPTAR